MLPFPQSNGYNLIFRPAFPVLINQSSSSFEAAKGDFDTETGLGDISFDLVYGRTMKSGFLWSAGIFGVLPTETDDALGTDQWKVGPDVVLGLIKKWGVSSSSISHSVRAMNLKLQKDRQSRDKLNQIYSLFNGLLPKSIFCERKLR